MLTWNRAAERTSGFKFREVRGRHLFDLCVAESQQSTEVWLRQFAMAHFATKSREINLTTKETEELPISWACSRMLDDERRIVGLVAVGRDLTERKWLEAQLITSSAMSLAKRPPSEKTNAVARRISSQPPQECCAGNPRHHRHTRVGPGR